MRIRILITLVVFFNSLVYAQGPADIQVKRERTFTGKALYGFMNGGSDLYLEYDFQELKVTDVVYKGEEYTIEIYRMSNLKNAFGIYSIHAFKCLKSDYAKCFSCLTKYQLQAVSGDKCIFITSTSGTDAAQKGLEEISKKYIPDEQADQSFIPEQLSFVKFPYSGILKYAKGELGTFQINQDLPVLLDGIEKYEIWFVAESEKGPCALFLLNDTQDGMKLKTKIKPEQIIQEGEKYILISF